MTTIRIPVLAFLTLVLPIFVIAAPPAELGGKYVLLNLDRLEFPDASSGSHGAEAITYTYSILDDLAASLVMNYPSSGRRRSVTLNFPADGSPSVYQEFDFTSTNPPMPPVVRSGIFELGDLAVAPPPPIDSAAPASLTGSYLQVGWRRFEFLTDENGRRYLPGKGDYYTYSYTILDELTAKAVLSYEDGIRTTELLLTFNAGGSPVSCTSTDSPGARTSGSFAIGTNRHLGDLKIGTDEMKLLGNDYFNAFGLYQTAARRADSRDTIVYPFSIENDGDTDFFRLRATRDRHTFRVEYFSYPDRENLTAAISTGRYETTELGHRASCAFTMELTPLRPNGAFVGEVSARSLSVEEARDAVFSFTHVNARTKRSLPKGKGGRKR